MIYTSSWSSWRENDWSTGTRSGSIGVPRYFGALGGLEALHTSASPPATRLTLLLFSATPLKILERQMYFILATTTDADLHLVRRVAG